MKLRNFIRQTIREIMEGGDNDPRYLYPDLFKDIPTQTEKEWIVRYFKDEVTVKAYNKGEAIDTGADIMNVPDPDKQYITAKEVTK